MDLSLFNNNTNSTTSTGARLHRRKITNACYIAIFLVVTFLFTDISDACMCTLEHPQQHACKSDFVIVATIQRKYKVNNYEVGYKFRLRKTFKAVPDAKEILKYGRILSAAEDSMCGVNFNLNKTYLLTGKIVYGKEAFSSDVCTVPYVDHLNSGTENFKQTFLQKYVKQFGCNCELSKRSRRKLFHAGLHPINNTESVCKIEQHGTKQHVRGTVKTMKAVVNICNFNEEWKDVSRRQQKGFRKLYYHGCDCDILKAAQSNIPGCTFNQYSSCAYKHGICLSNKDGICVWSQNMAQNQCNDAEKETKKYHF